MLITDLSFSVFWTQTVDHALIYFSSLLLLCFSLSPILPCIVLFILAPFPPPVTTLKSSPPPPISPSHSPFCYMLTHPLIKSLYASYLCSCKPDTLILFTALTNSNHYCQTCTKNTPSHSLQTLNNPLLTKTRGSSPGAQPRLPSD